MSSLLPRINTQQQPHFIIINKVHDVLSRVQQTPRFRGITSTKGTSFPLPFLQYYMSYIDNSVNKLDSFACMNEDISLASHCWPRDAIDQFHELLHPFILTLLASSAFRFFKINLDVPCRIWSDCHDICMQPGCAVEESLLSEIPSPLYTPSCSLPTQSMESLLSSVDPGLGPSFTYKLARSEDFCDVDDDNTMISSNGKFVDLLKNPERFTGYDGPLAHRIWKSIYTENCFHTSFFTGTLSSSLNPSFFERFHESVDASEQDSLCIEQKVFYKLISGLHTSISMHICDIWLEQDTNVWGRNITCYENRFARFPGRLDNLYFLFTVMIRALHKLMPSLLAQSERWSLFEDGPLIAKTFEDISKLFVTQAPPFDEALLFSSADGLALKAQFKAKFRNVSRIMDCVTCTKCRLWGKIQVQGLGTALKILYSYPNDPERIDLSKSELSSFINLLGRTCHSLGALKTFRLASQVQHHECPAPSPDVTLATGTIPLTSSISVLAVPTPVIQPPKTAPKDFDQEQDPVPDNSSWWTFLADEGQILESVDRACDWMLSNQVVTLCSLAAILLLFCR